MKKVNSNLFILCLVILLFSVSSVEAQKKAITKSTKTAITKAAKKGGPKKPISKKTKVTTKPKAKLVSKKTSIPVKKEITVNKEFESYKGYLPWPVEGDIIIGFGKSEFPSIPNVYIESSGISIDSQERIVKTIYPGTVKAIMLIPGGNHAILIDHEGYYSVYSNLSIVNVKSGDRVIAKQQIGTIYTNNQGRNILGFQLWRGSSALDPTGWIMYKPINLSYGK